MGCPSFSLSVMDNTVQTTGWPGRLEAAAAATTWVRSRCRPKLVDSAAAPWSHGHFVTLSRLVQVWTTIDISTLLAGLTQRRGRPSTQQP